MLLRFKDQVVNVVMEIFGDYCEGLTKQPVLSAHKIQRFLMLNLLVVHIVATGFVRFKL